MEVIHFQFSFHLKLKTVPASRYQAAGPWGLAQTWKKNVRPWSYGAKWGEWDDLWSYGLDHSPFPSKPFQHQSSSIIHHPQWENLRKLSVHGLVHWAWSLKYCRCGNMAQSVYLDQKMARLVQRSGILGWNQHTQWGFQVMTSIKLEDATPQKCMFLIPFNTIWIHVIPTLWTKLMVFGIRALECCPRKPSKIQVHPLRSSRPTTQALTQHPEGQSRRRRESMEVVPG